MASEGHTEDWTGYYEKESDLRDLRVLQKSGVEKCVCFNMQQGCKMIKTTKEYFGGRT